MRPDTSLDCATENAQPTPGGTPGWGRVAKAEARLVSAFAAAPSGMVLLDHDGLVVHANRLLTEILQIGSGELVGRHARDLVHPDDYQPHLPTLRQLWHAPDTRAHMNVRLLGGRGQQIPVQISAANVAGHGGRFDVVLSVADMRELRRIEAKVAYLSRFDAVTGLQNRRSIHQAIAQALENAHSNCQIALLTVNIDRFQTVNDRLGHAWGDHVLATIAARLSSATAHARVGRLGADEFAVIVPCLEDDEQPLRLAERLRAAIARPITAGGTLVHVTGSIGVAVETAGGTDADSLIQRADIALHRARRTDRWIDQADEADAGAVRRQLEVEAQIAHAVHTDAIDVAFQPIWDVEDRIVGVEALLRPHDVAISPAALVAAAERSGLIVDVGRMVVDKALALMPVLEEAAGAPLRLSINISARQLQEPSLAEDLLAAAAASGLSPDRLCVELTESAAVADIRATAEIMTRLRSAGATVAIDDFGIGYSSFSYLRDLPVDEVKIDRSFVQRLGTDLASAQVLRGMIELCRGLGLEVVCEGVETSHQRGGVIQAGCHRWQGFLGSRPLPALELASVLGSLRTTHPSRVHPEVPGHLAQLLDGLGLVDLLVFRRIAEGRYAHVGGAGAGKAWAGNVEVDLAGEPQVAALLEHRGRAVLATGAPVQVLGPYYATTAVVIQREDVLVVVGHQTAAVTIDQQDPRFDAVLRAAASEIVAVSPAKSLADELELLQTLQSLLHFSGTSQADALHHLLAVMTAALSCDLGVAYRPDVGLLGVGAASATDEAMAVSGGQLAAVAATGPRCVQHAASGDLPAGLVDRYAIGSWYALPMPTGGVVLLAHTMAAPRGFTGLCQRLAVALVDASGVLFNAARARHDVSHSHELAVASPQVAPRP
ncbi:MAG TPA: EAL domain-containing protein [Euzebya sp.]|nr:EAL domain-containing protein [Euzebya sp.]